MPSDKEKVAQILNHMGTDDAKNLLNSIASNDDKLADDLKELMFTFDTLLKLGAEDIGKLHQKIDKNDLLLAMKGSSARHRKKLLEGLSARKKQLLSEEFELMGKVRRSDAETAKNRVIQTLRQMIEQGSISLDDEWVE
ncbi:MAG: FliG C-terminal domain-containing protein [Campylobacterota bacterium]